MLGVISSRHDAAPSLALVALADPGIVAQVNTLSWLARVGLAVMCLLAPVAAHAETADELVAEGQELARQGRIGDALARFRAADAAEPRPVNSCLIGLAYLRGGALGNAELSFTQCHRRAQATPLPAWVAKEEQDLAQRLAASELGTVTLTVDPTVTTLTVPALLDGAAFPATRTLRLPAGTHRIAGRTAAGRELALSIDVRARGTHDGRLAPAASASTESPTEEPATLTGPTPPLDVALRAPVAPSRSIVPTVLLATGGAALVAGGLVHVLAVRPARADLDEADSPTAYDDLLDDYTGPRNLTVALYAVGAAAVITGAVLGWRRTDAPVVSASVGDSGAAFAISWQR